MGIFDRLFGPREEQTSQPDVRFGRYSDSYKTPENYSAWDEALEKFEKQDYLDSYWAFFHYLRDDYEDNVKFERNNGRIDFTLYQGSKKIIGYANDKKLKAEAKIAYTEDLNVGFMRRLIEQNFDLKYSRYAMDADRNISIVFDTYTLDGSPYKLYYALKELATNADKQDDLLLDEFEMLQPVETSHLIQLPEDEKEIKYQFICSKIEAVLTEVEEGKLKADQYPGGIAYLLLDLIYRLDYLTKPEGFMMELLERIHRLYFAQDGKTNIQKNQALCKELKKLKERPKEQLFHEMYRVKSTFGITNPVNHDRVVAFIDGELNNMDWYKDHQHWKIAMAVPGYVVGYCMFNYAVPKPDREFLHLYYQIIENTYFKKLGFSYNYYDEEANKLNKKNIKRAIDQIAANNKVRYPRLYPATGSLNFSSLPDFSKTYLLMLRNLDMTKAD